MKPQPAYLLHKRPYRETSALVDLLTLEHGRIRAVAQGVQRAGSKTRAILQPFSGLHVTWVGDGELKRLRIIESTQSAALLAGEGLICGLYANELLTRALPLSFPASDVFAIYTWLLEKLTRPQTRAPSLRRLEITLLETLDLQPRFLDCDDRALDPIAHYRYVPHQCRFARIDSHLNHHLSTPQWDGRSLKLLADSGWDADGFSGISKGILRAALDPLLGSKPLRSRELMQRLIEQKRKSQIQN